MALKRILAVAIVALAAVLSPSIAKQDIAVPLAEAPCATDWSYSGLTGPEYWGRLKPEYRKCSDGKLQSPRALTPLRPARLSKIDFNYNPRPLRIKNYGYTIKVSEVEGLAAILGSSIELDGTKYDFEEFHFHTPPEHPFRGSIDRGGMEIHVVHKAGNNDLHRAVVAVFVARVSQDNPDFNPIWDKLPAVCKEDTVGPVDFYKLLGLTSSTQNYITYDGSLTTPPCTEGLKWLIMPSHIRMSSNQITRFQQMIGMVNNARPIRGLSNNSDVLIRTAAR